MSKDLYVGHAHLFKLGKTNKHAAIVTIDVEDLATFLADEPESETITLKILPRKEENVEEKITHSVKYIRDGKDRL
jgi:hypothetical protein